MGDTASAVHCGWSCAALSHTVTVKGGRCPRALLLLLSPPSHQRACGALCCAPAASMLHGCRCAPCAYQSRLQCCNPVQRIISRYGPLLWFTAWRAVLWLPAVQQYKFVFVHNGHRHSCVRIAQHFRALKSYHAAPRAYWHLGSITEPWHGWMGWHVSTALHRVSLACFAMHVIWSRSGHSACACAMARRKP